MIANQKKSIVRDFLMHVTSRYPEGCLINLMIDQALGLSISKEEFVSEWATVSLKRNNRIKTLISRMGDNIGNVLSTNIGYDEFRRHILAINEAYKRIDNFDENATRVSYCEIVNDRASFLNSLENLISHQRSDKFLDSETKRLRPKKWQDYIENSEIIEEFIVKALADGTLTEEDISGE